MDIPHSILELPDMAEILLRTDGGDSDTMSEAGLGLSNEASEILLSAAWFCSKASDTRLTTKPVNVIGGQSSAIGSVSRARAIKFDRQKKRDEYRSKDTAIRVAATLWSLDDNQKMTQVRLSVYYTAVFLTLSYFQINSIRVTCVVGSTLNESSKRAMGDVLKKIGTLFLDRFPHAQPLTWHALQVHKLISTKRSF